MMPLILGGKGLGAWLLYNEQPAGVDPLSPENHLIFHNGPLTGTTAPTSGRFGVTTKSPATGTYFDAYCGGYWGNMLKYAGYDALVVTGASQNAGHAGHRWRPGQKSVLQIICGGRPSPKRQNKFKDELGPEWQSLVIGPPGEAAAQSGRDFQREPGIGARRGRCSDGIEESQSHRRARQRECACP